MDRPTDGRTDRRTDKASHRDALTHLKTLFDLKAGNWDCTTKKCDAICEGNGDPHYRTFDGKNYDFMGDCRYYLVKTADLTIIVENRFFIGFMIEGQKLPRIFLTGAISFFAKNLK